MNKKWIKYFSYGVASTFVVLLILLAAGAMFFTDDKADMIANRIHQAIEPMEIHGNWLGMKLTALNSHNADRLGVPSSLRGVVVGEVDERNGWRARQAGVQEDDIIVGVNGKDVRDMADMYDVSRKLDVGSPVLLNILRWGQPMTLVLPAQYAVPPDGGPPQARRGDPTPRREPWRENPDAVQPGTLVHGYQGPLFHCPQHNKMWPQNAVHPNYRCPIGNGPLNRVR